MATKKEKQIEKAQKFALKGYFDKAIAEYKSIVAADPSDISLRLRIGELYVKTGLKEEAIKEYSSIGKYNTTKGFYLKAIAVYKQVLKLDGTSLEIHNKLADLYTKQRLIADAIGEYSYILNTYEKKGRTSEAFDLLKKMVDIDQENAGLKLRLADMQKKLGYADDALDLYCWVLQKFLAKGRNEKAEKLLRELYVDHPTDVRVLEGLVVINREKGDISQFTSYAGELMDFFKEGGEPVKLEALCNSVLELAPDNEKAREALAGLAGAVESEPAFLPEEVEVEEISKSEEAVIEEVLEQSVMPEAAQEEEPEEAVKPEEKVAEEGIALEEVMEAKGLEVDPDIEIGEDIDIETTLDEEEEEEFFEIDFDDIEDEELEGTVEVEEAAGPEEAVKPEEAFVGGIFGEAEKVGVEAPDGGKGPAGSGGEEGSAEASEVENDLEDITGLIDIEEPEEIEIADNEDAFEEKVVLKEGGLDGAAGPSETAAGLHQAVIEEPGGAVLSDLTDDDLPGLLESDLLKEGELEDITVEPSAGDIFDEVEEVEAEVSAGDKELTGIGDSEDELAEELLEELPDDAFEEEVIEETAEEAAADVEEGVDSAGELFSEDVEEPGLDEPEKTGEAEAQEVVAEEQSFSEEGLLLSCDNEEELLAGDDNDAGEKNEGEGFIDLTKELGIEEALGQLVDSWSDSEESSGMVEEFKAGMGEQLGREDVETHFTLGIAYMEMELYDDAVREFKLSAKEAAFEFNSYARLGQCSVAMGNAVAAVGFYIKALAVRGMSDQDRIGAIYELALAYDLAGEQSEALYMMTAVGNLDPDYREVREKLVEFSAERSYIPGNDDLIEIELM